MNATSTFAPPTVARSGFDVHVTADGRLELGQPSGTTTERAALFGPFRVFPAQQLMPQADPPSGRQSAPGKAAPDERIPPVPDLALRLHSTGAKP
jgi:hypothetical protein